jgi:AraC-like DNA-binding protein
MHDSLIETHIIGENTTEQLVWSQTVPTLREAGYDLVGITNAAAPYAMIRPRLPFSELMITMGGEGRVWLEGEWHPARAGSAYVVARGQPQAFKPAPGRRWRFAWVHLTSGAPSEALIPGGAFIHAADPEPLRGAVAALHHETMGAADPAAQAAIVAWLTVAVRRAARPSTEDARLRQLWAAVDAEPGRPWTRANMARHANISGEHLRRLCIRHLGTIPQAYLADLRLQRAALLLRSTPLKLAAIAELVGYGSPYALSAAFSRRFSCPPGAYRAMGTATQPLEGSKP